MVIWRCSAALLPWLCPWPAGPPWGVFPSSTRSPLWNVMGATPPRAVVGSSSGDSTEKGVMPGACSTSPVPLHLAEASLTSAPPLSPPSLPPSHAGLLAHSGTCQAGFGPWAFAVAIPSTLNVLPWVATWLPPGRLVWLQGHPPPLGPFLTVLSVLSLSLHTF